MLGRPCHDTKEDLELMPAFATIDTEGKSQLESLDHFLTKEYYKRRSRVKNLQKAIQSYSQKYLKELQNERKGLDRNSKTLAENERMTFLDKQIKKAKFVCDHEDKEKRKG